MLQAAWGAILYPIVRFPPRTEKPPNLSKEHSYG